MKLFLLVTKGFSKWNKPEYLKQHVGRDNSHHNVAKSKCEFLMDQNQHIETHFDRRSSVARAEYKQRHCNERNKIS
ncbi:hypothetical protein ZOSMA_156G00170 [Zostera marina]|uniref:DUF4371 domain-containing protein n=1 Tax=Zostera marina TaxID=29655 RepID=A0A0K9PVK0_ZOSMR|nr:hypothetical protein ZOSMA_156G00170 [Zostera marina]